MKIKMTLTKTEKIMAILNQWDPEKRGTPDGELDWREYQYEADTIAQHIRSNSSVMTVEKYLREVLKLDQVSNDEVKTVAVMIQTMLKR